jgi:hypothetical protein
MKTPQKQKKKESELRKIYGFYKNFIKKELNKIQKEPVVFTVIGGTIHTELIQVNLVSNLG